MKKTTSLILGASALLPALGSAALAAPPPGYTLAWSEEFHQPLGSGPDPARWKYDLGNNGWGNQELETYVDDRAHSAVVADRACTDGRALQITTTQDGPGLYKSARINTAGKAAFQYGYMEARIKLPATNGLWGAFWMLGDNVGQVGWPRCGEIDILENLGKKPAVAYGSLHGPGYSGGNSLTTPYTPPSGKPLAADYHLYAVQWAPGTITFLLDGIPYVTRTAAALKPGQEWAFDHTFFFVLNVAVGGGFPGPPDATTVFPQTMRVDYVRVYQRPADAPKPAVKPGPVRTGL